MAAITAPVGKNGKNDKTDSLTIQCLLNAFIHVGRLKEPGQPPLKLLKCDSNPGPKTIKAIEVFQKAYMTEIGSCTLGRVDPHSDTLTRLLKNLDPPMGTYGGEFYGGACPTLPERPDLDDPAGDPHTVFKFSQGMYDGEGFCMAWSSKWAYLRGVGKDFSYDPETKRAAPPGADIIYAQNIGKYTWWRDPEGLKSIMGQFRIGIGHPDFEWSSFDDDPEDKRPKLEMGGGGGCAAHLVARHPGQFLHVLWSRADKSHAVAYEHEQLADGRSRFRVADPNSGQFLFNSAANFASWNSKYFQHKYWFYDGRQRLFRVKTFA